jgi:S-DNA-T family DNA segregation ATPase FtsK/SpoIIIE
MPGDRREAPPSVRIDHIALGLLLVGFVIAVCLFSFEPFSRDGAPASNLLGEAGHWLAGELYQSLGSAVYVFLAAWFVLVLFLFMRKSWRTWARRLAGWVLLVPCATLAADWLGEPLLPGPVVGSGGAVGAWLSALLDEEFSPLGSAIVLGGGFALGLLLAADFVVGRVCRSAWAILRGLGRVLLTVACLGRPTSSGRRQPRPELKPEDSADIPIHRPDFVPRAHDAETKPDIEVPAAPAVVPIARSQPAPTEEQRFEGYELPPLTLLEDPEPFPFEEHDQRLRERATLLEKTFKDFELNVRVVGINTGPVITQYEIALETGMRVNKVTSLGDDLALHLRVPSVRIVAPIPGKNTVGIEVPNENRATVRLKEVLLGAGRKLAKTKIPLFLGKDTEGRPLVYDLADMPHLLIAGSTGTGKSVCMNAIILSMLMTRRPDEIKMIMIDPKMTEMTEYGKIPHLMHPVVKDMKKAEAILAWAVDKMEERYDLLSRARVRHVSAYNELGRAEIERRLQPDEEEAKKIPEKMPYIVILVDELNDLMMLLKREVEGHIIRLAQKSRAAGIHLVLATQKPTVDVITGLIKSNLPGRICFKVSSRSDSRVVLDEMGADKLLGKGDMLFLQPGTSILVRAQGTYASDQEITSVVGHLETEEPCYAAELIQLKTSDGHGNAMEKLRARDDMYEQAIEIVVREGRGSVSLLQRALGIGYGRAARLIDFMAEDGIVGAYNGSNAREVLFTWEDWEQMKAGAQTARA